MEDVCLKNAGPDDSPTTELSDEPCEDSNAYADDNGQDGQAVDVVIPLGGDDCTRTRDFYATPHIYLRWRTSRIMLLAHFLVMCECGTFLISPGALDLSIFFFKGQPGSPKSL